MIQNPSANKEAFYEEIKDEINNRLKNNLLSTPPDFLYRWILEEVFLGYEVIPKNIQADYSNVNRLAEVISQWIQVQDVPVENIPVESILQHLASEGWIIIPPRT